MSRAQKQNQWLKVDPHKRTVNLACRLIGAMTAPRIRVSGSSGRWGKAAGGHRHQISGPWSRRALRPRSGRIRNHHHIAGDPHRAICGFVRRQLRASDPAASGKWRSPPRQKALTRSLNAPLRAHPQLDLTKYLLRRLNAARCRRERSPRHRHQVRLGRQGTHDDQAHRRR
jgi:hypothetical protein